MVIYGIYAQVVGRSKSTKIYVGQWTETKVNIELREKERKVTKPWKKGKKSVLEKKCDTNIINHLNSSPSYKDQTDGQLLA